MKERKLVVCMCTRNRAKRMLPAIKSILDQTYTWYEFIIINDASEDATANVLSQCSNFLIFKINHPTDLDYIEKMVPNISSDIIEKQKSLQSGTCIAFGKMMKLPMIVKMELPSPKPSSASANIYEKWMYKLNK